MNYFFIILLLTLIKIYFCFRCGFNDLKHPQNDTFISIYDDNDTINKL